MSGRTEPSGHVLNAWRWVHGAETYADDLKEYRIYMVDHEFGHALGNGLTACPAVGSPAPVMAQQTKGLAGCTPNPGQQTYPIHYDGW